MDDLVTHVREMFHYNPDTGIFKRIAYRDSYGHLVKCDYEITGTNGKRGYLRTSVRGKRWLVHTLAFVYMKGRLPIGIDHIDGNRQNNKWENLREVAHQENMLNKGIYKNTPTGTPGVLKKGDKYYAEIQKSGIRHFAGYFDTFDEALERRLEMEKGLDFHTNHGKRESWRK